MNWWKFDVKYQRSLASNRILATGYGLLATGYWLNKKNHYSIASEIFVFSAMGGSAFGGLVTNCVLNFHCSIAILLNCLIIAM